MTDNSKKESTAECMYRHWLGEARKHGRYQRAAVEYLTQVKAEGVNGEIFSMLKDRIEAALGERVAI